MLAILGKRFGLQLPGLDEVMPSHPTLGDVDSAEALEQLPGRQASLQGGRAAGQPEAAAAATPIAPRTG